MKRDLNKAMQDGRELIRQHGALDLSITEVNCLYSQFQETATEKGFRDAFIDTIIGTYYAGLAIGSRNA